MIGFPAGLGKRSLHYSYERLCPLENTVRHLVLLSRTDTAWSSWANAEDLTAAEEEEEEAESVDRAITVLSQLVSRLRESRGIPAHRVFVGGFGTGAAAALHFAVHRELAGLGSGHLGGVFLMGGHVPPTSCLWRNCGIAWKLGPGPASSLDGVEIDLWTPVPVAGWLVDKPLHPGGAPVHPLPVHASHGCEDSIVPVQWALATASGLARARRRSPDHVGDAQLVTSPMLFEVTWAKHPGVDHEVSASAIHALVAWLADALEAPRIDAAEPVVCDPTAALGTESAAAADSAQYAGALSLAAAIISDPADLDFTLSAPRSAAGPSNHTATFSCPSEWVAALCRFPVTARGALFEVIPGAEPGTLECAFSSTEPAATAKAIQARLLQRLKDPAPPGAEECRVS